jgi:hypothetical protein
MIRKTSIKEYESRILKKFQYQPIERLFRVRQKRKVLVAHISQQQLQYTHNFFISWC